MKDSDTKMKHGHDKSDIEIEDDHEDSEEQGESWNHRLWISFLAKAFDLFSGVVLADSLHPTENSATETRPKLCSSDKKELKKSTKMSDKHAHDKAHKSDRVSYRKSDSSELPQSEFIYNSSWVPIFEDAMGHYASTKKLFDNVSKHYHNVKDSRTKQNIKFLENKMKKEHTNDSEIRTQVMYDSIDSRNHQTGSERQSVVGNTITWATMHQIHQNKRELQMIIPGF